MKASNQDPAIEEFTAIDNGYLLKVEIQIEAKDIFGLLATQIINLQIQHKKAVISSK